MPSIRHLLVLALLILAACAETPPPQRPGMVAVAWSDLPGWQEDQVAAAMPALLNTCSNYGARADDSTLYYNGYIGRVADWRPICAAAFAVPPGDSDAARVFFETWFQPFEVQPGAGAEPKFTGYFAPELRGSWTPTPPYLVPIHRRPGVERDRRLTRAEIASGLLDGKGYELLWVDDPIDAFFLEIQGSGLVRMTDGSLVGVKFDGQNGREYVPVGRVLVEQGLATLDEMSMDFIRLWMRANPARMQWLMNQNPSYVYFRLQDHTDVIGAHDVPLTAGRSMAVDDDYWALGTPLFVDITDRTVPGGTLRRLLVAQDVGGAIRGPGRGDVYWGVGSAAGAAASAMNATGRLYALVPRAALTAAI